MEQKGFSQDWLDRLKFNNDIVSVISKYLPLKKNGKTFWACCPFHHEKTASFAINSQGQYYHCFGCGVGGNVISFVQKIEGVDFLGAVKILAKNANMEIPEFVEDKELLQKRKRVEQYERICTETAKFYNKVLNSNAGIKAREYLQKRGVEPSTITKMGLGFSPDWTSLVNYLHTLKISNADMVKAGVCGEKNGKVYDFMAGRLIFPVINHQNKVVGFSGRALEKTDFAKYKNTSQTDIFNKSSVIFGLHTLRKARLNQNYAILVEGQMDVVSLYQAGFENAIATMGTAFNKNHVRTLSRFVDKVVVCFDGDSAGQKAIERSLEPLLEENFDIKVIELPEKLDPDEYIKKYGADKFSELLNNALEVYEFEIKNLSRKYNLSDNRELSKFVEQAITIISSIKNDVESQKYIEMLSSMTKLDEEFIKRKMRNILFNGNNKSQIGNNEAKQNDVSTNNKAYVAEQYILACLLQEKDFASQIKLESDMFSCEKFNQYARYINDNPSQKVASMLDVFGDVDEFIKLINFDFSKIVDEASYFQSCVNVCKLNVLNQKLDNLKAELSKASDVEKKAEILNNIQKITKEIQSKKSEG